MKETLGSTIPLSTIEMGVYKYVIVDVPYGDSAVGYKRTVRIFKTEIEHSNMRHLTRGEQLVAAGFIAIPEPGKFIVQNPISGSLDHKGDIGEDEAMIEELTDLKCSREQLDVRTTVNPKAETRIMHRRSIAYIDYAEAKGLCDMHELDLTQCLEGEALLIPGSGVKLVYQTRMCGWMLYGYAHDGSDVVTALRSIVSQSRVCMEK